MSTPKLTIRLLKPGTFNPAFGGDAVTFGRDHLEAIALSYDAAKDPAPIVIGHPKLDAPAMGWVDTVRVEGDELVAEASSIEPAFAEAVRDRRYAKVSAQLYPPGHPSSPAPDGYYLQHVGFLGAAAPAVKGLGTVSFSEADAEGALAIDVEQDVAEIVALSEEAGQIEGDGTGEALEPEADAEVLTEEREAPAAEEPPLETGEAEAVDGEPVALSEREEALAAREAQLVERERALELAAQSRARAELHQGNVAFAEGLIAQAKLAPAGRALVVGLLDTLEATATISFGEADGELAPATALKKLLAAGSELVSLAELAPDDGSTGQPADPSALAARAEAFQRSEREAGRSISIAAAVRHVEKQAV